MRSIKTLALAAAFAVGTSAFGLAEEAAPDSIANQEPIFGTWFDTAVVYAPQTVTTVGSLIVPASPWIAQRFSADRNAAVEENWFLRAEAANVGGNGSSE
jgi:hypothetical protein